MWRCWHDPYILKGGISFEIVKAAEIMADFEYSGVRLVLEARLDRLKQRIVMHKRREIGIWVRGV